MKETTLTYEKSTAPIICETIMLSEFSNKIELLAVYEKYANLHPVKSILLTLDDRHQAEYTSGHTCNSNDLDDIEGHDLSSVHRSCFEDGEHKGYLSHPSEFFIRKNNFLEKAQSYNFESACKKGLTMEKEEIELLEKINQEPLSYLDEELALMIVPVEHAFESISAFPNGYFSSDLDPFENYAFAKRLENKYEYKLLGIGTSLIAFRKNPDLTTEQLLELSTDLGKLYHCKAKDLNSLLQIDNDILFLKYSEYLE